MIRHLFRRLRSPLRLPRRRLSVGPRNPSPLSPAKPTPTPATLPPFRSLPFYAVAGTAVAIAAYVATTDHSSPPADRFYADLEETLERSKGSVRRFSDHMRHTAAAAAVLWRSLASVMSSANQEVRSGFELRVAALLADISAASDARRAAIVGAGGGAVVDWLLESVGRAMSGGGDQSAMQAEAARALSHLIADRNVSGDVLGRPGAIPNLLRFIFSVQPKKSKKHLHHSSYDGLHISQGRSMLVAALMDIITSNCENVGQALFQPVLPGNADMRDIAAALEVVEQGGMHLHDHHDTEDSDDGDKGMRGIGIKVLGGTTVLGCSRPESFSNMVHPDSYLLESSAGGQGNAVLQENVDIPPNSEKFIPAAVPGLWDDLQREHVAVPFATWALANWAFASELNRCHIQELDSDGHAVMTALKAPERTVKWHGCLLARALVEDQKLSMATVVSDWISSLLSTAFHASNDADLTLTRVALSALLVCVEQSSDARAVTVEKGLNLLRGIAKQSDKNKHLQEDLARVLELLYKGNKHLSLEESWRWSSILLQWVFDQASTIKTRLLSARILSFIIEDYGPESIPVSQGWLALMLEDAIRANKSSDKKGVSAPKADDVKNQIDQSNAYSAAQVSNQLSMAVIKLAAQLQHEPESFDGGPLADLFSLEPFSKSIKNFKKNNLPKFDAADSAVATLKGIKSLAELCSKDAACQTKIVDYGILCLLRNILLSDDYEKLAANEAYASHMEAQSRNQNVSDDSSRSNSNDASNVRVPPTAHSRRHAARLLTILSLMKNVKKVVAADEVWCKWLEDCANGKNPSCNDPKIQSYSRATLLNISCSGEVETGVATDSADTGGNSRKVDCPQFGDMIFLLNPGLSHWKVQDKNSNGISNDSFAVEPDFAAKFSESRTTSTSSSDSDASEATSPVIDVVFIHGLRGGPFKSWRIADNKSSTTGKAGLVEYIDQDAGKQGTCWPSEWLGTDLPDARIFTVKYKTNLTQWSGASLPLQEVSSMLLRDLTNAGIGDRPVVFVTHSMGGLVVKQMLHEAKLNDLNGFLRNTAGVIFYSCPHFGSKLADMPWRMGLVLRPAPTIGELRSGSPRLIELNDFIRRLNKKGLLNVLSFSETQVTPIVEGYGGWALRMEIVSLESAYPGFGELVVLDATDHINSCKPVNRTDPSYAETLQFLKKLKEKLR